MSEGCSIVDEVIYVMKSVPCYNFGEGESGLLNFCLVGRLKCLSMMNFFV